MLNQMATGIYTVDRSIGNVTMRGSGDKPKTFVFDSDYFTQNGTILVKLIQSSPDPDDIAEYVKLTNEMLRDHMHFAYPNKDTRVFFSNTWISALRADDGEVKLYVLERSDGTVIILQPDGIWYASNGDAGVLESLDKYIVVEYTENTTIVMTETVSGENVKIIFGGKNTSLNDDENYTGMNAGQTEVTDSDYANVITNNLQILPTTATSTSLWL